MKYNGIDRTDSSEWLIQCFLVLLSHSNAKGIMVQELHIKAVLYVGLGGEGNDRGSSTSSTLRAFSCYNLNHSEAEEI